MRVRISILAGASGLVVGAFACAREAADGPRLDATAFATRVAEEASTELALYPGAQIVSPSGVRLEDGLRLEGGLTTYRAWISRDHWHAYQLAVANNRMIPLGGFQSPDLVSIASAITRPSRSATNVREVAEKLALLADNSGGVQYAFPGRSQQAELRAAWSRASPASWPSDTVINLGGGGWSVRLTLLSQETRSFTQHWVPTAYAFTFDSAGQLHAWSRRAGEPIPQMTIPTIRRAQAAPSP